MYRYCVLSIPRTGSTWLTNGIGSAYSHVKHFINLGEFFTPYHNVNFHWELNENKFIQRVTKDDTYIDSSLEEFVNRRMQLILNGNTAQPLVLKYMCMHRKNNPVNNLENLQKLRDHNIIVVNLCRDAFDSTVSMLVSEGTGIVHRWPNKNGDEWSTYEGLVKEISTPKIEISLEDFEITYFSFIRSNLEKQKIADLLGCATINYNSLRMDCLKNSVPFHFFSKSKKVYDIGYDKIVENYDELINLKNKLDSDYANISDD